MLFLFIIWHKNYFVMAFWREKVKILPYILDIVMVVI